MLTTCATCGARYDDAEHWTFCPHDLLMPAEDLERKKAGMALIGKRVRFAYDCGPEVQIQAVGWNGMVTIKGFTGEFAPHLFVEVCEKEST